MASSVIMSKGLRSITGRKSIRHGSEPQLQSLISFSTDFFTSQLVTRSGRQWGFIYQRAVHPTEIAIAVTDSWNQYNVLDSLPLTFNSTSTNRTVCLTSFNYPWRNDVTTTRWSRRFATSMNDIYLLSVLHLDYSTRYACIHESIG